MPDLRLEREFATTAETLFAFVTTTEGLLQWWGPEGMTVPEHALDLSRPGPWFSVMVNGEGQRFKVSGEVVEVAPPRSVTFTWAWHDENDARGAESRVTFTVEATAGGARLVIDHRELADAGIAENHEAGWTSSLRKLEKLLTR